MQIWQPFLLPFGTGSDSSGKGVTMRNKILRVIPFRMCPISHRKLLINQFFQG